MDIISMHDFSKEQIIAILDAAEEVKRAIHDPEGFGRIFKEKYGRTINNLLEGKLVGTLFLENSTRTFFSTRTAVIRAGGRVDGFPSKVYTSLEKGETWCDTSIMFQIYSYDAIVMRSTTEGLPRWTKISLENAHQHLTAQHAQRGLLFNYKLPLVINAGDGKNQHPTQCLLDLFTIREIARAEGKSLDGLDLALLNDLAHGRTNASLMSIAHLFNFKLHFAYPKRFGPKKHRLDDLKMRGVEFYDYGENFIEAMKNSFIAYHSRPQKERVGKGEDLISIKEKGQITKAMYDLMGEKAPYLMHPKPVDAEEFEEIAHDMNFHPKNITNLQASNGLYIRIALLALGLGRMKLNDVKLNESLEKIDLEINDLPLKDKNENMEVKYSRSGCIKKNGIVIDHIPAGMARRLVGILGLEGKDIPKVISDYMPVKNGREPVKDMLKLHCHYELSPEQYQAIALIAPKATISIINGETVVNKMRPVLGNYISNRVKCVNTACVTNVKREHAVPEHLIEKIDGKTILRCKYCETPETISQIYEDNRFIYIDGEDKSKG